MKDFITVYFILQVILAQTTFIDPDYISSVDSVECNRIFPFAFDSPGTGTTLVDWDLQNFSDNDSKFTSTTSTDQNYASTTESYIASCYRDSGGLFCGVTYEIERTFKWLRQITDAHPTGKAAIKNSASLIESAPSTSQLFQPSNDYRVYVAYEATDQSTVVFVSFNYLSGEIENVYRIHKGVTELANTMIMQHIMGAAALDGVSSTSATEPVVSLIMSYNSEKAFEIQMSNIGMKNPVPKRILDYQSKYSVSAPGFQNSDFRKVLGISAKGKPQLPKNGQNDVIQTLYPRPNNNLQYAVYTMQKKDSAYEYWVFSATAFLTFSVSGSNYQNTIWWYVSRKFENQQQIAELSYTFTSVAGALTSYAVSPDAPQLCMTSEDGPGGSFIYIDDVARAAVQPQYKVTYPPYTCGPSTCYHFDVDFLQSELPIGLKQYSVNKPVVVIAINTQMETVSNTQDFDDPWETYFSSCKAYTTILLEQKDTGTIHLVQLNFRRSPTFNDQFYSDMKIANYGSITMDCISEFTNNQNRDYIDGTTAYYKMYSYQINTPASGYQLFSKGLVNLGFDMTKWGPTLIPGNEDLTSKQELSFYVAGVNGKKITFDTNNLNLRCQSLSSQSSLDLALVNDPTANNQAFNKRVLNPVYRFLNGAPYQTLTQVSAPLSPLKYQPVAAVDATFFKSVSDPTREIDYDYSVCKQPKTFGLDPKVQKGLLCLEINTNLTQNSMNTQGVNLVGLGFLVSQMDLNMWPYSNCWDRSTNPFSPISPFGAKTDQQIFSSFFTGWVANSNSVKQADPTNTIKFSVYSGASGNTDDSLQINFLGRAPGTLGLQPELLRMVFKIGADAKNVTWDQKTMFQLSCQPADFVWQTRQDNRMFPLQATYFFGQGPMKIGLPQTIPTNLLTKYNIDQYQYISFNYSVLYTSNTTGPTTNYTLANVTIKDQAFVIDQVNGVEQWLMLGAIATSVEPYYYVKSNTNGKIYKDWIKINLTTIVNVTFVYNVAPSFAEPLQNVVMSINETVVINLPEILDPESDKAFPQMVLVFPSAKFWNLQNTKEKTGSYITLKPTKNSQSGTYLCIIYLIDVTVTPRQSSFGFEIKVLSSPVQPSFVVPFIPKNTTAEITFKPDSEIGIKVEKVFTNSTVKLRFNLPMQPYINPLFTENSNYTTNVTKVLPQYLQLQHKQQDLYSKVVKRMEDPNFQAISFDGLFMYLQLEFSDFNLLSQSATESTDYIYLNFNETEVFISQNDLISTTKEWYLEFILPVQQSSLGQAVQAAAETVSGSFTGLMSANFVVNLLMSTSLQKMWGNLNVLQLVVATPLLQVNLPQNVFTFCQALLSVTQFQLFDSTLITDKIFGVKNFSPMNLEPLNERMNQGGYQQTNFIYNMGCMFYISAIILSFLLMALILTAIKRLYSLKIIELLERLLWRYITPQLLTRLFFEINFELTICSYLQIKLIWSLKSGVDYFSGALAIAGAALCLILPIISTIVISRLKTLNLLNDKMKKKYFGELYQMQLVPNPTLHHLLYNVFFMMRRLATVVCIFNMARVPSFQIGCMMWMTTFWTGYALSVKPFEDPALNVLEVINECFYNLILLLCFTFTELLQDVGSKTQTGYCFIALMLIMLAINIGVQIKDTVKLAVLSLKRLWMRYQARKKKWRKPLTFQHMPFTFSHQVKVQQILHQQYKDRVYNDIVGSLKSYFVNKFKNLAATEQTNQQTTSQFVNVKLKPALQKNPKQIKQTNQQTTSQLVNVKLKPALKKTPKYSHQTPFNGKVQHYKNQNAGIDTYNLSDSDFNSVLSDYSDSDHQILQLKQRQAQPRDYPGWTHSKNSRVTGLEGNQYQRSLPKHHVPKQSRNELYGQSMLIQQLNQPLKPIQATRVKIQNPKSPITPGMTLWEYIQMQEAAATEQFGPEQGYGRY